MDLFALGFQKLWRKINNKPQSDESIYKAYQSRLENLFSFLVGSGSWNVHFYAGGSGVQGRDIYFAESILTQFEEIKFELMFYVLLLLYKFNDKKILFKKTEELTYSVIVASLLIELREDFSSFQELEDKIYAHCSLEELIQLKVLPSFCESEVVLSNQSDSQDSSSVKTEKKKKKSSPIYKKSFEDQEVDPVMHSFEKLETADDYQGGRKVDSGDDDLTDHSDALDELNLNNVTRDGEGAQSVFQEDKILSAADSAVSTTKASSAAVMYPEWSTRQRGYRENFCSLFETTQLNVETQKNADEFWQKYRTQILIGQKQVDSLLNYPLWRNRLPLGSEIDLDSFIRDMSDVLRGDSREGRWYMQKKSFAQELDVFCVFDQSMSTDSWVQGKRVLDVILESILLTGFIFEKRLKEVSVVGTWSETRHHCHFHYYKHPFDSWEQCRRNLSVAEPKGYTRLGPAIRHSLVKLRESKSKCKLLLLFTDGKPTDLDGYEGLAGIEDIRKADQEAEKQGVILCAFAVDSEAKNHFSKMFRNYHLLLNPDKLPVTLMKTLLYALKK